MNEQKNYERARDKAVEAAWEAAHLIRRQAGRAGEVREKRMNELVTAADEEAQETIVRTLRTGFPEAAVLAEEGAAADPAEAVDGYRWIIDPIDGTTNFTRGVPPYSVSIGLQHEDRMAVGVVLDVAHGELFTAVRGGGLFVNGAPARVSPVRTLGESLITTGFPYRVYEDIDAYLDVLRRFMLETRGVRRPGSAAADFAHVAAGRFDGFFEAGLQPWDTAAGILLVEEGGGRVTDFEGNPHPVFGETILASNGWLHEAMLEIIAPRWDGAP